MINARNQRLVKNRGVELNETRRDGDEKTWQVMRLRSTQIKFLWGFGDKQRFPNHNNFNLIYSAGIGFLADVNMHKSMQGRETSISKLSIVAAHPLPLAKLSIYTYNCPCFSKKILKIQGGVFVAGLRSRVVSQSWLMICGNPRRFQSLSPSTAPRSLLSAQAKIRLIYFLLVKLQY